MEGNTTDLDSGEYTGIYIDDILIKVTKAKGFPLDLDNNDGSHSLVNTEAKFTSVLSDSPSNWTINTKNNDSTVIYNSPSGKTCSYTVSSGRFDCNW